MSKFSSDAMVKIPGLYHFLKHIFVVENAFCNYRFIKFDTKYSLLYGSCLERESIIVGSLVTKTIEINWGLWRTLTALLSKCQCDQGFKTFWQTIDMSCMAAALAFFIRESYPPGCIPYVMRLPLHLFISYLTPVNVTWYW